MFWDRIKSKEYEELIEMIGRLSGRVTNMELDLQIYTKKLRQAKGLGDKEKEEKPEDLYGGMFLPDNEPSLKRR